MGRWLITRIFSVLLLPATNSYSLDGGKDDGKLSLAGYLRTRSLATALQQ
jgi:hypothetical protein